MDRENVKEVKGKSDLQELSDNIDTLMSMMNTAKDGLIKAHSEMFNRPIESDQSSERQVSSNRINSINEKINDCKDMQISIRGLTEDFISLLA